MQSYTEIPSTDTLTASRDKLLNNDKTIMSNSSGTAFPATNLQVGMLCNRTDLSQIYMLTALTPTWELLFDYTKTATNKEYVDTQVATKAPTSHASTATTYGAASATNYGHAKASSATPLVAGSASAGTDNGLFAREGHVHPVQTSVSGASGSCTGNAATSTKLATARNINGVPFDGSAAIVLQGHQNYIDSGLKFATPNGLTLPVTSGVANVSGEKVSYAGGNLSLSARKACLPYLAKTGVLGKVECVSPTTFIDNNTVGMWVFNQTAGAAVPNSAVGVSSIAVANNLTPTGTFTRVDGRFDYAIKPNGTNAYFTGANYTGLPAGNVDTYCRFMVTIDSISSGNHWYVTYGTQANSQAMMLLRQGSRLVVDYYSAVRGTGFDLEVGRTYLIECGYTAPYGVFVRVNGSVVWTSQEYLVFGTPNLLKVFLHPTSVAEFGTDTIHFLEIKNAVPADLLALEQANKLLISFSYDKAESVYPTLTASDQALAYHQWKFDETSGTTVADTAGTLNGTAAGTTIVSSNLGLGEARNFSGTASGVTLGNFAFPSAFTVVGVINAVRNDGYRAIFSNHLVNVGGCALFASYNGGGKLVFESNNPGSSTVTSATPIPLHEDCFVGCVVNSLAVDMYVNSPMVNATGTLAHVNTTSYQCRIGARGQGSLDTDHFAGDIDYLLFIPRALSQKEIADIYDAFMTKSRKNITNQLPADAIALGYACAGSSGITEFNDSDWGYGRREKAVNGNRRVFLGWKYFSGETAINWVNPFGTRKVRTYFTCAQDSAGRNEVPCHTWDASCGVAQGYGNSITSAKGIGLFVSGNGAAVLNDSWITTGYIGCYAEVLEDD